MKLYIARHAYAGDREDDRAEDDARGLTPDGRKVADRLGSWMWDNGEVPTVIYASPMARCRETAEILSESLGVPYELVGNLAHDQPAEQTLRKIAANRLVKRPMIVTHDDCIIRMLQQVSPGDETVDPPAMGELRIYRLRRNALTWKERARYLPSEVAAYSGEEADDVFA